jgi:hypothetical protein
MSTAKGRAAWVLCSTVVAALLAGSDAVAQPRRAPFSVEEATIAGIQSALLRRQITTVGLVELYLQRIKAYNGQ